VPAVTALAAWPLLGTPVHLTAVVGLLVATVGLWLSRRAPRRGRADTGAPIERTGPPVLVPALHHR
jgi:hypothetical protein